MVGIYIFFLKKRGEGRVYVTTIVVKLDSSNPATLKVVANKILDFIPMVETSI